MNINLLPKEPYVVEHFPRLVLLVLSFLLVIAVLLAQYVLNRQTVVAELERQVADLETRKSLLQKNIDWNSQVWKREDELKSLLKYKALTDGIAMSLQPRWPFVLDDVRQSLPEHAGIIRMNAEGNQVQGKAVLYTLEDMAIFMEQLKTKNWVDQVYLNTAEIPGGDEEFIFDPEEVIVVDFSIFTRENKQGETDADE